MDNVNYIHAGGGGCGVDGVTTISYYPEIPFNPYGGGGSGGVSIGASTYIPPHTNDFSFLPIGNWLFRVNTSTGETWTLQVGKNRWIEVVEESDDSSNA